jgi:methionyl-tRNA formyltransferase
LINGESRAGISVIQADVGIDTGRILAEGYVPIGFETTIFDLHQKANTLFPTLVLDALALIERGESGRPQVEDLAKYWHQRSDADGKISFREMAATQVDLMVRALTRPYSGAWCFYENKVLRIFAAESPSFVLKGVPGRLCYIQGAGPYVVCSDKGILLTDYEIEDSKAEKIRHGNYLF